MMYRYSILLVVVVLALIKSATAFITPQSKVPLNTIVSMSSSTSTKSSTNTCPRTGNPLPNIPIPGKLFKYYILNAYRHK